MFKIYYITLNDKYKQKTSYEVYDTYEKAKTVLDEYASKIKNYFDEIDIKNDKLSFCNTDDIPIYMTLHRDYITSGDCWISQPV